MTAARPGLELACRLNKTGAMHMSVYVFVVNYQLPRRNLQQKKEKTTPLGVIQEKLMVNQASLWLKPI